MARSKESWWGRVLQRTSWACQPPSLGEAIADSPGRVQLLKWGFFSWGKKKEKLAGFANSMPQFYQAPDQVYKCAHSKSQDPGNDTITHHVSSKDTGLLLCGSQH